MRFKNKNMMFPFIIRTGYCMIKDCDETSTDRHHIEYHIVHPLVMTLELCDMHHREENKRQEELQHDYYFDWNRTKCNIPSSTSS